MNIEKKHDRKLGLCAADLVENLRLKVRDDTVVLEEIRDELEMNIASTGYLNNAPFDWVTLALRYGLKNENEPHYQSINKTYRDLPLAIELDVHELRDAERDEFKRLLTIATLKSLIHAGHRYKLSTAELERRLAVLLQRH